MSLISPAASRKHDRLPLISLISDIYEDYKVATVRDDGALLRRIYEIEMTKSGEICSFVNMNFNSCPLLINLHKL